MVLMLGSTGGNGGPIGVREPNAVVILVNVAVFKSVGVSAPVSPVVILFLIMLSHLDKAVPSHPPAFPRLLCNLPDWVEADLVSLAA
jgi:hypothetical protein